MTVILETTMSTDLVPEWV